MGKQTRQTARQRASRYTPARGQSQNPRGRLGWPGLGGVRLAAAADRPSIYHIYLFFHI